MSKTPGKLWVEMLAVDRQKLAEEQQHIEHLMALERHQLEMVGEMVEEHAEAAGEPETVEAPVKESDEQRGWRKPGAPVDDDGGWRQPKSGQR